MKNETSPNVVAELGGIKDELVSFVDRLTKVLKGTGESLNRETEKTIHGVEAQVKETVDLALKNTRKKGDDIKNLIEEHPWELAAGAFAGGILLGFFLSKRND